VPKSILGRRMVKTEYDTSSHRGKRVLTGLRLFQAAEQARELKL